jgi:uncharacterized protein CbrC (UPF0167 family)
MEPLPRFRYHPDPVGTGSVKESQKKCECCDRARGFVYSGPVYAVGNLREALCPWCIATGAAADKFDALFSDDYPLVELGLRPEIIAEVTRRTPGFSGWQQETWSVHCEDACGFVGDASLQDLGTEEAREQLTGPEGVPAERWAAFVAAYTPGGNPSVYVFQCLHCRARCFQIDMT